MKIDKSLSLSIGVVFWPLWIALVPLYAALILLVVMTANCVVRYARSRLQPVKSESSSGVISVRPVVGHFMPGSAGGVHDHHRRRRLSAWLQEAVLEAARFRGSLIRLCVHWSQLRRGHLVGFLHEAGSSKGSCLCPGLSPRSRCTEMCPDFRSLRLSRRGPSRKRSLRPSSFSSDCQAYSSKNSMLALPSGNCFRKK